MSDLDEKVILRFNAIGRNYNVIGIKGKFWKLGIRPAILDGT